MLCLIKKATYLPRTLLLNNSNLTFFAKEAKPAKGDGKGAPAAPAAPVII
jgi:hypothetical protein